jgi:hypothetical protein
MEHTLLLTDGEPDLRDVLGIYHTDLGDTLHLPERQKRDTS